MIQVKKASGKLEEFSEKKVRRSLKRAGADDRLINQVLSYIKSELYNGITTDEIYHHVFKFLRESHSSLTHRYNLKRAIMDLGPTGFPFEKFVAGVLRHYGFETKINQIIKGLCIKHEVDIIADKKDQHFIVECKFHNRPGTKSEIKDALYTYARFLDINANWGNRPGHQQAEHRAWLITNTKVTSEVIDYAKCVKMKITSWDYPRDKSLNQLIAQSNLHPVTIRQDLDQSKIKKLLEKGIVFAKDL